MHGLCLRYFYAIFHMVWFAFHFWFITYDLVLYLTFRLPASVITLVRSCLHSYNLGWEFNLLSFASVSSIGRIHISIIHYRFDKEIFFYNISSHLWTCNAPARVKYLQDNYNHTRRDVFLENWSISFLVNEVNECMNISNRTLNSTYIIIHDNTW